MIRIFYHVNFIMWNLEWVGVNTVLPFFAKLHVCEIQFRIYTHENVISSLSLSRSLFSLSFCIWYMNSNLSERFTNSSERIFYSFERFFYSFERFTNSSEQICYLFERICYLFERFIYSSEQRNIFLFGLSTPPYNFVLEDNYFSCLLNLSQFDVTYLVN